MSIEVVSNRKEEMKAHKLIKSRVLRYLRKNYNTTALNKKFPQTRRQRLRFLAKVVNLDVKQVFSWRKGGAENIMETPLSTASPKEDTEVINGQRNIVSQKTILETRQQIARYNAGIMYNDVLRRAKDNYLINIEEHANNKCIVAAKPTCLVVVDMTHCKKVTESYWELLCRKKRYTDDDEEGMNFGVIQTALPTENIVLPMIKIEFRSILDRPGQANKALFGSRKKNQRIFADTEGINTASLQMLDRYFSEAEKTIGIDMRMIVVHDENVYFPDTLNHFVHGHITQLIPLVASRIAGIKLQKL